MLKQIVQYVNNYTPVEIKYELTLLCHVESDALLLLPLYCCIFRIFTLWLSDYFKRLIQI